MNEFERRLRAAMSAAGGPPPAGLMEGIRRRHRRHLLRVGAGCVAVAAALALAAPSATHALRSAIAGGSGPTVGRSVTPGSCPSTPGTSASFACSRRVGPGPVTSSPAQVCPVFCGPPPSSARAAPGTVLRNCNSGGGAPEIAGYRARSVRAGPVWFVWADKRGWWPASLPLSNGQVRAVGVSVAVRAGATAVLRVAPSARSRFRFLRTFHSSDRYRMRGGTSGITFAACPASYMGPVTVFRIGYLNDGLSCVPFEVSVPGHRPARVALSVNGGVCAA